jgi:nucleoside-diphosphate-sugar epimerase
MGGAGYVFTGENDADIMHNSGMVNLNILDACHKRDVKRIFYSSSACICSEYNQEDLDNPNCAEESVYPTAPESDYGWEKLFSERMYLAFYRNHGMEVGIARYQTSLALKGAGTTGEKKHQPQFVVKWQWQRIGVKSKSGAMVSKRDPFSTLTSALKELSA